MFAKTGNVVFSKRRANEGIYSHIILSQAAALKLLSVHSGRGRTLKGKNIPWGVTSFLLKWILLQMGVEL